MEEVWKDITLPSLKDRPAVSTTPNNPNFPDIILLDHFARPINNKQTPTLGTLHVSNDISLSQGSAILGSRPPTPATILTLNSCSDLRYVDIGGPLRSSPTLNAPTGFAAAPSFGSSHNTSVHGFDSSPVFPTFGRKRAPEINEKSNDMRHKRMMKNRESAARSRARKQAYTTELELEVAHLKEENAKLKRQQEKSLSAPDQPPKKTTLSRTLTAPF
ncbi:Detected protein of unknown function [Hibiscus syriacus]|uniref:BZIP domain-containing protein n=2 Tax=Hibiscus syriacus TaxID=106335 RepID=A0A6A3DA25_HIBSY|nr:Detected protein of unknown function [Hibiscus syriacus]